MSHFNTKCHLNTNAIPNPWWVSGLIDGEGNFSIDVMKKAPSELLGYQIQANFNITQRDYNRIVLDLCLLYFGVGSIKINNAKNKMLAYQVRN